MFGIDDAVVGSVVGDLGSSLLGGLFGGSSAKKQNKAAIAAQERANAFTRQMMQSRHQWEVADLKAAGLNPILSAGGTPSMGASSAAQVVNEGAALTDAANRAGSSIGQARNLQLLRDQLKLQNSQIIAQTNSAEADARNKDAQTRLTNITSDLDEVFGPYQRTMGMLPAGIVGATAAAGVGKMALDKLSKPRMNPLIKPSIKGVKK